MINKLIAELQELADKERAEILQRFFKTHKGGYGEGDIFLGIRVPIQRDVAKKYTGLDLYKLQELIDSGIHEHRQVCLIILMDKYKNSDEEGKGNIFNFYLKNLKNINNWDLVDISAPQIVGNFLRDKKKNILYELVKSENLWERRVAIISTFEFIKKEDFVDTLTISELLLKDKHDLIHKAVGWMLREVGKKDIQSLENFLKEHYKEMPRTMLRYAIEKFEEEQRKKYLRGEI